MSTIALLMLFATSCVHPIKCLRCEKHSTSQRFDMCADQYILLEEQLEILRVQYVGNGYK